MKIICELTYQKHHQSFCESVGEHCLLNDFKFWKNDFFSVSYSSYILFVWRIHIIVFDEKENRLKRYFDSTSTHHFWTKTNFISKLFTPQPEVLYFLISWKHFDWIMLSLVGLDTSFRSTYFFKTVRSTYFSQGNLWRGDQTLKFVEWLWW